MTCTGFDLVLMFGLDLYLPLDLVQGLVISLAKVSHDLARSDLVPPYDTLFTFDLTLPDASCHNTIPGLSGNYRNDNSCPLF